MKTKAYHGVTVGILMAALLLSGFAIHTWGKQAPPVAVTTPGKSSNQCEPVMLRWGKDQDQNLVEVLVNNSVVLRIRTAAGGYNAWQRGELVVARLRAALAEGIDANSILPGFENQEVVVLAGTRLLVTVDKGSVEANNTPAPYLALNWANNIRASLGLEPLEPEQAWQTFSRGKTALTARASWYGPRFHGRRTASGEVYNQEVYTAAHRTLPFGTLVLVTNPASGKSVLVRINDRGPFIAGRGIDLSRAAARAIGMEEAGVADVQITVIRQ